MNARHLALASVLFGSLVACGTIVGIHDTTEDGTTNDAGDGDGGGGKDAQTTDGATKIDGSTIKADAGIDAATKGTITGGNAHYLQAGEQVTLAYEGVNHVKKVLDVTANGPYMLPEPAFSVTVAAPPVGRRCWTRAAGTTQLDVSCTFSSRQVVDPSQTSSAAYTALTGATTTVRVDKPTTLLVAFSIPYATTSGPEVNAPDYLTLKARAIVDGNDATAIELVRGSTFFHQPWNQLLIGTFDVPAGDHNVAIEYEQFFNPTVVNPNKSRTAIIGNVSAAPDAGADNAGPFRPELLTIALESLESFDSSTRSFLAADSTLSTTGTWLPLSDLDASTPTPKQQLGLAYYPNIYFKSPGSGYSGQFTLSNDTTTLATGTMHHLQDENGYRSITLIGTAHVNGPYALHMEQATDLGPNVATAANGAGLTSLLFDDTLKIQTHTWNSDGDFGAAAGAWVSVPSTSFSLDSSTTRALIFANINLMAMDGNGTSGEFQLVDNGNTTLLGGFIQSWSFQYGQECVVATIADFAPGAHTLSVRARTFNTGAHARVLNGVVPDGRGRSTITVVPIK